jgi:hypothetical protein
MLKTGDESMPTFEALRRALWEANPAIPRADLAQTSRGQLSGIDRLGAIIRPSGAERIQVQPRRACAPGTTGDRLERLGQDKD